jgi:hypothetical protein
MKYLAILKDCFREAIDTKVLYVMIVLSVLLIIFLVSCTFAAQPADNYFGALLRGHLEGVPLEEEPRQWGKAPAPAVEDKADGPPALPSRYDFNLVEAKALEGDANSPGSTFLVTVRVNLLRPEVAQLARVSPGPAQDALERRLSKFKDLGLIRPSNIRLAQPSNAAVNNDPQKATSIYFEFTAEPGANTRRMWPHELQLFFGAVPMGGNTPLGMLLFLLAVVIIHTAGWVTLLISVVMTAFFIPNMLRKGTVDLLIVKPIKRPVLLIFKYLGGLTFIFLNTLVAVGGMWLALGLKSGLWANYFLLMIPTLTFFFAILYSVSTLFGVISRSPIVSILVTCLAWFIFFAVGAAYSFVDRLAHDEELHNTPTEQRKSDNTVCTVIKVLHFVTPRTSDLNTLGDLMLAKDFLSEELVKAMRIDRTSVTWSESISVSVAFIAVMLGAASWWVHSTDY